MNAERCIALHNEILHYGWVGSGRSPGSLESTCKTWFDTFGDEAEAVRSDLGPDLIKFLQHARVIYDPEFGVDLYLFYWVQNLASPDFMFEQAKAFLIREKRAGFSTLRDEQFYRSFLWVGHLCIISPTIYDTNEIFEQKVWYPLETALEFWLGQIRKGRIATLPEVKNRNYSNDRFDPWEFVPYNGIMLEENIDAFSHLVEAIEARMPRTANIREAEEVVQGLIDESVLQTIGLPRRFAYDFLRRARRPRFQMIAPGLEVLTSLTFPDQPFRSYLSSSTSRIPPILLFRFKPDYVDETTLNIRAGEPIAQLFPQFSRTTTYPAGLYLRPTSTTKAEDECVFILPFDIGANGYARKSDGSRFGRREHGEDSQVGLYRPGYQPFEEQHEQSFVDVLQSWRGMVERGNWQIDENGVASKMDVWREADSEGGWKGYVVPMAAVGVERQRCVG